MMGNCLAPEQYLTGKTIMVIGTDPWNSPLLSKHRLVLELCKQNQVIYVESLFYLGKIFRLEYWRQRGKNPLYHREYPASLSFAHSYRLPKSAYILLLRKISEQLFLLQLWLRQIRPDVIISFNPAFPFLAKRNGVFVYYPVDSYGHPEASAESIRSENETLALADLVTAGTDKLYRRFQGKTHHLEFLPHGVDTEALTAQLGHRPDDLQAIARPIIGFLGSLNFRLDLSLLEQIALNRPYWSLVLVGPYRQDDFGGGLPGHEIERLKRLPNIYLLGPRSSDQIGAYFGAFDVSIMPYDTAQPLVHFASHKPLQCLAVGTPVVTTCAAPTSILPPNTFVAEDPDTFIATIEQVLNSHTADIAQAYRQAAQAYTWKKRVAQLSQWLAQDGLGQESGRR